MLDFTHMLILILKNPIQLAILVVLVGMSLLSFAIGIERQVHLWRLHRATVRFMPPFALALQGSDVDQAVNNAIAQADAAEHRTSHLARVLITGLREFRARSTPSRISRAIPFCRRTLERSADTTAAELRRGLPLLATVASSAPFVGLLGTVFGVISSFQGIGESTNGGISAVSTGISEALFMTGVGLGVAIPAVWLFNYFATKIDRLETEIKSSSSELIDVLLDRSESDVDVAVVG